MAGSIPKPFNIAGQAQPSVGTDIIDALIWQSSAYGGTSDVVTVGAGARGGVLIWNPSTTSTLFVYGIQISTDAAAVARAGLVTSVPSGYVQTGAQIQAKHLQAASGTGLHSNVGQIYVNAAAAAIASPWQKSLQLPPSSAQAPFQFLAGASNVVLRPGIGFLVVFSGPAGAYNVAATFDWAEYAIT